MRIPIFVTQPFFQPRPWGGRAMAEKLGKKIPDGAIGESWEVSAHPNGVSRVRGGPLDGTPLDELVRTAGPDLLGARVHEKYRGTLPLLVKLIDVNSLASVQVHPDDEQARRLEGYPWGKTEAWYIIDHGPKAAFFVGLAPGTTRDSLRDALASGAARSLLASVKVKPGDCLFVPPGTVHAVGDGVLLLEIQQSSDITYRVYDWDRRDERGRPRELHIDKAVKVIDFSARPRIYRAAPRVGGLNRILSCGLFVIDELHVSRAMDLPPRASLSAGTLIEGSLRVISGAERLEIAPGDSFVIPAAAEVRVEPGDRRAATAVLTEIT